MHLSSPSPLSSYRSSSNQRDALHRDYGVYVKCDEVHVFAMNEWLLKNRVLSPGVPGVGDENFRT